MSTRIRHRPAGWRRRRLRKFERRRNARVLRIIEGRNRKRVRAKHRVGARRLADLFDGPARVWFNDDRLLGGSRQTGRGKPVRLRPNTPPVRDVEHQAKHRQRKLARAARKRNRT